MVAINNYEEMVQAAVNESVDLIIAGAGLPLTLPQYVIDSSTAVVPIVSSAKAFQLIARKWERNYNYCPDAVIVEGPLAGGHLGFSFEQLEHPEENRLEDIVVDVIKEAQVFEDKYGQRIPVIAAGGIWDGHDIACFLELGCAGVQMGTRFVPTFECDASENFKKAYLEAGVDDVLIIKSPVGMPGRAVRSPFITRVKDDPVKVKCQYNCLRPCDPKKAPYCIADALINAKKGNFDQGFAFCGANVNRVERLQSVHSLLQELIDETRSISPRTIQF